MNAVSPSHAKHRVVSHEEWLAARTALLEKEKEHSRQLDRLNSERLALPWERVGKEYRFDGPEGEVTLADLFEGRSQLLVQHFMFGPDWEEGCVGCSLQGDHNDAPLIHLRNHDVSFAAVARAPIEKIAAYKRRMGWKFPWVSSFNSDFNFDFGVSFSEEDKTRGRVTYNYETVAYEIDELPGWSAFYRDPESGEIFHTYSAYSRGAEALCGAFAFLDIAPLGRNETGPNFNLTDWARHHDKYESQESSCGCHKS